MQNTNQIKTHFDIKIILFFIMIFIVSCGLLAFKMNESAQCKVNDFSIETLSYKAGELITFSDDSKDAYNWAWDFGDGSDVSYRSKVAHAFSKPGKYTVKLSVNNACKIEKAITILPKEDALNNALFPKFFAPKVVRQGEVVKFKDSTSHAKSWEWSFEGMKVDAIDKNPTYVFSTPGEKVVSLVVNGEMKYVKQAKITVLPSKKDKADMVLERLKRRNSVRVPVQDYIDELTDEPKRGPEIANLNEAKFKALVLGVSENKLSYQNLLKYFCSDQLPLVQLNNGKSVTLKALDESIRNRGIKIKSVMLHSDKDGCVNLIGLDYKYKGLF